MIEEVVGIIGLIFSLIPLVILPLKIRTGMLKYFMLYIFLVLFYASYISYYFTGNNVLLALLYVSQMLFFLNIYRSYLAKELFLSLPAIFYVNDFALIFSFYFATFNLAELLRNKINKKNVSMMAVLSLIFFDVGIIFQMLRILSSQDYFSTMANGIFLIGTIFFIVPALRVVRKG
ncbi:MAG: hypothetical protein ACP5G5_05215 [Thermoplasmata archaeon]